MAAGLSSYPTAPLPAETRLVKPFCVTPGVWTPPIPAGWKTQEANNGLSNSRAHDALKKLSHRGNVIWSQLCEPPATPEREDETAGPQGRG